MVRPRSGGVKSAITTLGGSASPPLLCKQRRPWHMSMGDPSPGGGYPRRHEARRPSAVETAAVGQAAIPGTQDVNDTSCGASARRNRVGSRSFWPCRQFPRRIVRHQQGNRRRTRKACRLFLQRPQHRPDGGKVSGLALLAHQSDDTPASSNRCSACSNPGRWRSKTWRSTQRHLRNEPTQADSARRTGKPQASDLEVSTKLLAGRSRGSPRGAQTGCRGRRIQGSRSWVAKLSARGRADSPTPSLPGRSPARLSPQRQAARGELKGRSSALQTQAGGRPPRLVEQRQ